MKQPDAEHTGVIMPPPVIYGVGFVLVLVLHWLWPVPILQHSATPWVGGMLAALGILVNGWGALTLRRGNTAIHPNHPASHMITSGPFRFSRNPLYIGLNLVFLGLALIVTSAWGLLMLIPVLLIMHYGVILREECHLEAKFGESFRAYRDNVRRYL